MVVASQLLGHAALLTEAGREVGLGHLVRCVALSDALEAVGCPCRIVVAGESPSHVTRGHDVCIVDWRDPTVAVQVSAAADIVVIDSYVAQLCVYEAVAQEHLGVWLDDTARIDYPPGIVVNGNPDAARLFEGHSPEREKLLGVRYQLLRNEFANSERRSISSVVRRVLIVAGGTDAAGVTGAFTQVVNDVFPNAFIEVATGARSATEMRDSMISADVCLTAAGQTLYELAAVGTPAVAVAVADNQITQAQAFDRAGAVSFAGVWTPQDHRAVRKSLIALADFRRRREMSRAGQEMVDGCGAARVTSRAIGSMIDRRTVVRRAVSGDEMPLLELANDEAVRHASFDRDVISSQDHHRWFNSKLLDPDCMLLMFIDGERLAGYVRFDRAGDTAEVSIALARAYRGIGLGGSWLERAIAECLSAGWALVTLCATISAANAASRAMFRRAGFVEHDKLGSSGRMVLCRVL